MKVAVKVELRMGGRIKVECLEVFDNRQTDEWTDIADCSVAFTTYKEN